MVGKAVQQTGMPFNPRRFVSSYVVVAIGAMAGPACAPHLPSPATPASPPLVSVVAWNMHEGRGNLPRLVADLGMGRLSRTPATDYVLLLQEATTESTNDVLAFARQRKLSAFFAVVRTGERRTIGNAILATRALTDARSLELPAERQPRNAALAFIRLGAHRLFAVSVHLENRTGWLRGGLFSENARGRQADALLRMLPSGPGIVGGDLNTWLGPREPAWRVLLERFRDTPTGRPSPTFRDRLTLDSVFFELPGGWRAAQRVLPDGYGSDHHPVLAEVFGP